MGGMLQLTSRTLSFKGGHLDHRWPLEAITVVPCMGRVHPGIKIRLQGGQEDCTLTKVHKRDCEMIRGFVNAARTRGGAMEDDRGDLEACALALELAREQLGEKNARMERQIDKMSEDYNDLQELLKAFQLNA